LVDVGISMMTPCSLEAVGAGRKGNAALRAATDRTDSPVPAELCVRDDATERTLLGESSPPPGPRAQLSGPFTPTDS